MTIGDDLQKEVETTKEKVSSLIAELETFAEIKSSAIEGKRNPCPHDVLKYVASAS